ncbi:hybrid sensor histidine kinase/response regulator [Caballeronia novacaledonica]|uniref:ATP-binding response regulator n=1 Tax=Caballeronia novacaledonica TaxID=1544861 RepID=UPI001EE2A1C3|nr:hybrid sensor histidine kinase/response regulator [Caballeronia novacaledonica]GJH13639.1 hybrid sensor histidine kinase/response regulator [Caballeronia novacaledonica]
MNLSKIFVRKFDSPELERAFLAHHARRSARQRLIISTVAPPVWGVFGIRDWWMLRSVDVSLMQHALEIRAACVLLMGVWVWGGWHWRRPLFYREGAASAGIFVGNLIAWIGVLGIMWVYPADQGMRQHLAGLLLVFYPLFIMFRLRTRIAAVSGTAFLLVFQAYEAIRYLESTEGRSEFIYDWLSTNAFLATEIALGLMVCVQLELAARGDFLSRRTLRAAKARADAASFAMAEQNETMTEMTREKERFFSSAYHDIQQPLAAINLFVSSAQVKLASGNDARSDLGVVAETAGELLDMFKGIQDYSELGSRAPVVVPVDTLAMLNEVCGQYREMAHAGGICLRISKRSAPPPPVETDRSLFKRAVSNLVSNAIRNTPEGGVVVGWVGLGDRLRIDVRDTGIGIAPEYREAIFSEYYQIGNPGRDRTRGLGLGLSIVRRIIGILPEHDLGLSSTPGRGSRFSVYVPISAVKSEMPSSGTDVAARGATLTGKYAILCDDEPIVLEGLRQLFADAGALLDTAQSLREVESMLTDDARVPDVIITDIRLRDGPTGVELARRIRQHFAWAGALPVAFITGELMSPGELRGFAGPYVLLRKSSSPAELLDSVNRLVSVSMSAGAGHARGQ